MGRCATRETIGVFIYDGELARIMGLLDDVTVVEVAQVLTGPFATTQLGDMGAEVIKVEPPTGELDRDTKPFMGGISSYFMVQNRNKQYLTVDLKDAHGKEILEALLEEADVLVENLSAGAMNRLGFGFDRVQELNDDIIYCSIKGFSSGSRYSELPAFDFIVQAMSGTMSITGSADGEPVRTGVPIGDITASMYAVQAILAALYARDVGDQGRRHIEVPMLDCLISWLTVRAGKVFATGEPYSRGNTHTEFAPFTLFETSDSYLAVAIISNSNAPSSLWAKFCNAIDIPELIEDDRFKSNDRRLEHADELYDILSARMREKSTDAWFDIMKDHRIPAGPVYDTLEMWEDPYISESDLRVSLEREELDGPVEVLRHPVLFDHSSLSIDEAPGPEGADTEAILTALGYSAREIAKLQRTDVI